PTNCQRLGQIDGGVHLQHGAAEHDGAIAGTTRTESVRGQGAQPAVLNQGQASVVVGVEPPRVVQSDIPDARPGLDDTATAGDGAEQGLVGVIREEICIERVVVVKGQGEAVQIDQRVDRTVDVGAD